MDRHRDEILERKIDVIHHTLRMLEAHLLGHDAAAIQQATQGLKESENALAAATAAGQKVLDSTQ